jgi:Protein of unknown function (DUF3828)
MKNPLNKLTPTDNKNKETSTQDHDSVAKRSYMKYTDPKWIHTSFLVLFAFHIFHCNSYSQKPSSAESFLVGLYASYQSQNEPDFLGKSADSLFTPGLLHLIRADQNQPQGNVGLLNYDPLCDCQDFDFSNFRVIANPIQENNILAEINFSNFGTEVGLDITLKKDGSRWRIADIHTKSVPSLYNALQAHQK